MQKQCTRLLLQGNFYKHKLFSPVRFYAAAAKDNNKATTSNATQEQPVKKLRPQENETPSEEQQTVRFGGQEIPAHLLQALREKKYDKLSKSDFAKLEQTLDKMATQTSKFEDESSTSTPFNMINMLLAAIALVFAVARTRDALENEHLQELLHDTEQELGNEILRLRQQQAQLQKQVMEWVGTEKRAHVEQVFAQMAKEDAEHVAHVWKKQSSRDVDDSAALANVAKLKNKMI